MAKVFTIENPVKNSAGELVGCKGITLDKNNKLVETPEGLEIVKTIKALPRKEKFTGSNKPKVEINGTVYSLSYKFYTEEEVETYTAYRHEHKGTGGSGSGTGAKLDSNLTLKVSRFILEMKDKSTFSEEELNAFKEVVTKAAEKAKANEAKLKELGALYSHDELRAMFGL